MQQAPLLLRFDALRHHIELQRMRQGDDDGYRRILTMIGDYTGIAYALSRNSFMQASATTGS